MTDPILVTYATKHWSTREVAEAITRTLAEEGLHVELEPVAGVSDLTRYQGVVLGTALYMGRAHADGRRFLRRHREALARLPVAIFGMGPLTTREDDVVGARSQLERSLAKVPEVAPFSTAIFGGVVDPAELHFPLSRMEPSDARDWVEIESWAHELATAFRVREPAVVG